MEHHANHHRGERILRLDGETYPLRASFAALAEIEAATGHGLIALGRRLANGEGHAREVLAILKAAAKAAGRELPPDADEKLLRHGLAPALETALSLVVSALIGDQPQRTGDA